MDLESISTIYLPKRSKFIQHLYIYDPAKPIQKTLCGKIIVDGMLAYQLTYEGPCDHCLDQKRALEAQHQAELERLAKWNAAAGGGGIISAIVTQ